MRSRALQTVNKAGSWMSHVDMTALILLYIVRKIRECVCPISNEPTSSWIIPEVKRKGTSSNFPLRLCWAPIGWTAQNQVEKKSLLPKGSSHPSPAYEPHKDAQPIQEDLEKDDQAALEHPSNDEHSWQMGSSIDGASTNLPAPLIDPTIDTMDRDRFVQLVKTKEALMNLMHKIHQESLPHLQTTCRDSKKSFAWTTITAARHWRS
ncbi:hypothetical protein PCANC_20611 [Puccinia coronata f. sp. avenae]|uniref:Uncharacterized protein n=1 Tax=Puccinia coronata f. sp. avenae TaxID=200324 RepID=A0A2N5T4X0_9BASI|nr:hypothetical protein PCANC_20611 [Puccinia coronata f. sp. avenae]